MCFSIEADVVAGVALLPVAALSLREVRHVREVPFAALPLLFALHQLTEALVWAGLDGHVSANVEQAAALVYVLFAFPVLPTLVPTAVLLLEPKGARLRVAPFVALGLVVSAQLMYFVLSGPLTVTERAHAVLYGVDLQHGMFWAVLYVVATVGPALLSGYPSIVAFGALNLVGLSLVALIYREAFASLWCVLAALLSVMVLLHMYRRRRLPDQHRLHGQPLEPVH
ncbi:DUF6629 family protein [Aeromicrobium duanguangcaii]|uniref:Uncharacterized protein n=1 Tax=Aeromicrobium duanguangcaii TaxID=2968086 RepID=A0ABY5KFP5_9ACTN|nr:DUF6629 family protein [Aeromicrobium duanguangcaii]MCD9154262.1 hypothetical protein [Aeromicrobium duanguangcaii]UUI68670.1 hypothetical protein NP095_00725 [Aeromicrobium duanguangcaii]